MDSLNLFFSFGLHRKICEMAVEVLHRFSMEIQIYEFFYFSCILWAGRMNLSQLIVKFELWGKRGEGKCGKER
jgi:hypothetical protein